MVLYYYGVPLSALGNWLKVHKTTVLRWMIGLSLELFPIVYRWIYDNVIDEKWLKIRGKWHYWFVVLDSDTGLPVLASLLGTRSQWACRWIGVKLKQMGKIPREVITDGMSGYRSMVEDVLEKARHNLCHFHHQQRVTVWLKKRFQDKEQIAARKSKMKKVFQTDDKRTVRSRLGKKSWAYQNGHSGLKKSASCPINFALTICATLNSITWGILISDLRFSIEPD